MKTLINYLKQLFSRYDYKEDLKTFARSEFKKDWQYAYYALLQNKNPREWN